MMRPPFNAKLILMKARRLCGARQMRKLLTVSLMFALVLGPISAPCRSAHAAPVQDVPPALRGREVIIRSLDFDTSAVIDFEFRVSLSLLLAHGLDLSTDKDHLFSWGRSNLRAALFLKLAELAQQDPSTRTAQEQSLLKSLTLQIKQRRYLAAFLAQEDYRRWQRDACTYTAAPGFTAYEKPCQCYSLLCNNPPVPPAFELFQAYGATLAHQQLLNDAKAQLLANDAAKKLNPLYGLGAIAASGAIGAGLAKASLTASIIKVLFPYATRSFHGSSVVMTAARAASSAGFVAGTALTFLAIATAIVVGVFAGISLADAEQLPVKLQEAVDRANAERVPTNPNRDNPDPFLKDLLATDVGKFEVWAEFLAATHPKYDPDPFTAIPAPAGNDPKFVLQPGNTQSTTLTYLDWEGKKHTARLSGGWFVDKKENEAERLTLDIDYVNHQGEFWTATRRGPNFIHSRSAETPELKIIESAQIDYRDGNNASASATIIGAPTIPGPINIANFGVGALTVEVVKGTTARRPIGIISPAAGDTLDGFTVTINGGNQTTREGITISDLMIESSGRITALVAATCNAQSVDYTANENVIVIDQRFELAASKGGTGAGTYVRVQPTTSTSPNPLPVNMPDGSVGIPFTRPFEIPYRNLAFSGGCLDNVNPTLTISSGKLPPGLSLAISSSCDNLQPSCNLVGEITGTPTTMGVFPFTLKLTFLNGETHTRTYRIYINNGATEAPEGMIGWWPGEGDTTDASGKFNHARPSAAQGNQKYARGWAGRGFSFEEGSHGGIFLPNTIFPAPPLTFEQDQFTFETWFKITPGTSGLGGDTHVILGQENIAGTQGVPAIYVGNDGKLRAQMFWNGSISPITSASVVNDGFFHHVAVTEDGGFQQVYLDGQLIGARSGFQQTAYATGYQYRLGAGRTEGWPAATVVPGANGYSHFIGVIDEAAVYDRALSPVELGRIYAAGSAGKFLIKVSNSVVACINNNKAFIRAEVAGTNPPFTYALDDGQFQQEGHFNQVEGGDHLLKVKDGDGKIFTRSVTIEEMPFSISPGTVNLGAAGGRGQSTVRPGYFCSFTATSNNPEFITATADNGTGKLEYTVASNPGAPRTGTVTVSNGYVSKVLTIQQEGRPIPTITAASGIIRQAGSPSSNSPIATVNNAENTPNSLTVKINGGTSATVKGVTVSNIVNTNGSVMADIVAVCSATNASFTLTVADGNGETSTATLNVAVVANTAPSLSYPATASVDLTGSTTINPTVPPGDNNSITSLNIVNVTPPLNTAPTIDSNGVITISHADPSGTHAITVRATDNCGVSSTATISLNVICKLALPTSVPSGTVGAPYSANVSATPSTSASYSVIGGGLPPGLSLNPMMGAISGTPTTIGSYTFSLKAQTGGCGTTQSYTIAIGCPTIALNPPSLSNGTVGAGYSATFAASPAGSYQYSVSAGTLPAGLSLNMMTGALNGKPTAANTYTFTITAKRAGNCTGSQTYTVLTSPAPCPASITLPALPNGKAGQFYSGAVGASPSGSYSYAVSGTLPPGVSLIGSMGLLIGTPTTSGAYRFTITATRNGGGGCTGSRSYEVTIAP